MHPRLPPLVAAVLATALAAGCSAGSGEPPPERPSALPGSPAATADADPGGAAGGGGEDDAASAARPELTERAALALTTGREVFVRPSCTPDASGERGCWSESAPPYELDPGAAPAVAVAAATDLDRASDSWTVEVVLARGEREALERVAAGAAGGDDDRLALVTPEGDLLALAPAGTALTTTPDGTTLRLPGLAKPAAYDLVAALVELAEDQARTR